MRSSPAFVRTSFAAVLAAMTSLPAQQVPRSTPTADDLAAVVPAETVLLVEAVDVPALLKATRRLLYATRSWQPQPLRAGWILLPVLARGATGLGLDELATELGGRAVGIAAIPGPGEPRWVGLAFVEDVTRLRTLLTKVERSGSASRILDDLLVVATDESTLDDYEAWRAAGKPSLLDRDGHARTRAQIPPGGVRAFVDLEAIRPGMRRDRPPMFEELDAFGRLVAGPTATVLDRASRLDGTLQLTARGIELELRANASAAGSVASRVVAGGADGYRCPPPPDGTVAHLVADRSLHAFFAGVADLLTEDQATEIEAFLSIADTLLGDSFVDGLLPTIADPLHFWVVDRDASDDLDENPILLPSFVVTAALADPRAGERLLRRAFANIMVIQQAERRQNGLVPFSSRTRRAADGELLVAVPEEWRGPGRPPLACSMSPTLAFANGHAVLSSTEDGARRALRALAAESSESSGYGDRLHADPVAVARWLELNRTSLVLQNVLNDGATWQQAEREFGFLTRALAMFSAAQLKLDAAEDETRLRLELETRR